jgi:hypothetical protein
MPQPSKIGAVPLQNNCYGRRGGQDLEEVATESAAIQQEPTSIKPAILITLVKIHHFPVGGFKSFSTPRPPKGPMGQWVSCFARGLTGCLLAQF